MATWVDGVPEVVFEGVADPLQLVSGRYVFTYSPPRERLRSIPFGNWSANGALNFDSSRVNDLVTDLPALNWPSGAGTAEVVFYSTTANYFQGVRIVFDTTTAPVANFIVSWSADGSVWNEVSVFAKSASVAGVYDSRVWQWSSPVGTPLYWKVGRKAGWTDASVITEIWFFDLADEVAAIDEIRIYDNRTGNRALYLGLAPSATARSVDVHALVTQTTAGYGVSSVSQSANFVVVAVRAGMESTGRPYVLNSAGASTTPRARYMPHDVGTMGLGASGLQSDIILNVGPRLEEISGPTGAFSLGGFEVTYNSVVEYVGGETLRIYNPTVYNMTIVHESGSSTAINRINTLDGLNVTINGPGYAEFARLGTAQRWLYLWGRDSIGLK